MAYSVRRLVTGLDDRGRSTILFDDSQSTDGAPRILWHTGSTPADNSGRDDAGGIDFATDMFRTPGSSFMLYELAPAPADAPAFLHATDTIDYIVVLQGRIELQLEAGTVELSAGDVLVDRGVIHAWRALDGRPAVTLGALVPAHPVGAGATV